jgi:fructokinase
MVSLGPEGDARYTFAIEGGADDGWRADALPQLPANATALHVSGALALALPAMGDALEALLARERAARVIAFDPNPRPALTGDLPSLISRLRRWVGYADIVKLSEEDLAWTFPGLGMADAARLWHDAGTTVVVVTRGADGVYASGPDGAVELPAPPVKVVDTVGAGDTFMAGLLADLHRRGLLSRPALSELTNADLTTTLHFAQLVAAVTCQRAGADPPWLSELDSTRSGHP